MKQKQGDQRKRVYDFYLENRCKDSKQTIFLKRKCLEEAINTLSNALNQILVTEEKIIATDVAMRKGEILLVVED